MPANPGGRQGQNNSRFGSIRDFQDEQPQFGPGDSDDDYDDHRDRDAEHNLYAGNGLSILPNGMPAPASRETQDQLLRRIMTEAARQGSIAQAQPAQSSRFEGAGYTLGDEETPSQLVAGPVTRRMTIWRNGFSFDNRPFIPRNENDPVQTDILRRLYAGQAPLEWLDVRPGQEVGLEISDRSREDYEDPNAKKSTFVGSGNRFSDSVASGLTGSSSQSGPAAGTSSSTPASTTTPQRPTVDPSLPVIKIRFNLPLGTHTVDYNNTHTLSDLYSFVDSVCTGGQFELLNARNEKLDDVATALSETSLHRGGVVRYRRVQND